jgi:hypothetical protein
MFKECTHGTDETPLNCPFTNAIKLIPSTTKIK